jgi:hypothetical protein
MGTVQENLLPSAMVPGLVTVKDKKGRKQNVYPVDAKELIASGDFELVENGAIEASRLAATPLRSGSPVSAADDQIIAEVSGVAGSVVGHSDPDEAERIRESSADADGNTKDKSPAPKSAREQEDDQARRSAAQGQSSGTASSGQGGQSGGQANRSGAASGGQAKAGEDKK